nr:hypothetical protein [Hymenobacter sp. AT01-02]
MAVVVCAFGPVAVSQRLDGLAAQESMQLDPLLKQMALTTLVFTLLFGLGQVL